MDACYLLGSLFPFLQKQEQKKRHLFCNVSFIYFSHFRDENTLYSRATLLELD